MDPRQPPHTYTRPHQTPVTSQPYSSYPPQSHTLHVSSDPYHPSRHDPFLPAAAQHVRRGSYGHREVEAPPPGPPERHGGWGSTAHHASSQSGPPPPPSMTSHHGAPNQPQYSYEAARRRSLSGASPTDRYGAPSHDAPPPPSYARPHMPPPLSPQQQHSHAPEGQRAHFTPMFGGGRELPGLGPAHRPGSSMSISSLIGGGANAGAANQTSQSHSSPPSAPSNTPTAGHHSMQPPSPRRGNSNGSRSEFQHYRRQPSPDKHSYAGHTSRGLEVLSYGAGSPSRAYSAQGSPDQGRQSLPHSAQPYKPMLFQGQRPYASSPSEVHARDPRHVSVGVPPRPSSQPSEPQGAVEHEARRDYEGLGVRRQAYGAAEERRRTLGESQHSRPNVSEILGAPSPTDRDRPVTVQPVTHSAFSPPRMPRDLANPHLPPGGLWRHARPEDAPRETTEIRRDDQPGLYRGYGSYTPSQGPPNYGGHSAEDMVRGRSLDVLSHRVVEQYHAPPTSDPHSSERYRGSEPLARSLSGGGSYPGRMYDQHSKSFLALGSEANRRTGRASPLPQAVQGAQAQPLSGGKDPGIKSEFGRMFSGLGSGLGSSTPSRQSPMPQSAADVLPPGVDMNDLRLQRVSSQNGRKPKRVKDEEGALDNESIDGRGTPSARGSKRNKYTHAGHHHHHHPHAHHHHHHHHKPDEEVPLSVPPPSATPLNGRYPLAQSATPQPPHHHHHYHAAPHHHHHAPRATQPITMPSPKLPAKVHDIQAVLDEAAKHPRHHLGSYLYEATPELPQPNSPLDDQFCYASKPRRLPLFERDPVNCIVTCRVHRYYLKPRQRQQIVLQRHLWGARVYRDDSDPIAAAIHSGWIRGEWDETVDVAMLDPRISAANDPSDAEDYLSKPPAAPVTPPADMELHIDILVLPRVEQYAGTVEYGISSRKSKTHDGLSFMVHSMRWVEEGVGSRGQERTAAAMKRRLDASRALLDLINAGTNSEIRTPVNGTTEITA